MVKCYLCIFCNNNCTIIAACFCPLTIQLNFAQRIAALQARYFHFGQNNIRICIYTIILALGLPIIIVTLIYCRYGKRSLIDLDFDSCCCCTVSFVFGFDIYRVSTNICPFQAGTIFRPISIIGRIVYCCAL